MAVLGVERIGRGLCTVGLILFLYLILLPGWFRVAPRYTGAVTWASTHLAFPLAGLHGAVQTVPGGIISLNFILPDARSGWGQYRQRMLNYVDIPLALAVSLGLLPLPWRRRLVAASSTVFLIFAGHVGLVLFTAGRLGKIMGDPALSREDVERLLPDSIQAIRSYGDLSLLITLGFVGGMVWLLWPRRRAVTIADPSRVGGGRP